MIVIKGPQSTSNIDVNLHDIKAAFIIAVTEENSLKPLFPQQMFCFSGKISLEMIMLMGQQSTSNIDVT